MEFIAASLSGAFIGAFVFWLFASRRHRSELESEREDARRKVSSAEAAQAALAAASSELRGQLEAIKKDASDEKMSLRAELSKESSARVRAETERKELDVRLQEERTLLSEAREKLTDTFKALAGSTLDANNQAFLSLAKSTFDRILSDAKGDLGQRQEAIKGIVEPINESLKRFNEHVQGMEKERQTAYSGLSEQMKTLAQAHEKLGRETSGLVNALRAPQVRGRWGEMTLRRVVEVAGMSSRCDFTEQVTTVSEDGTIRPDMIIHLPANRDVVVDAKISLDAYLDAVNAQSEEERKSALLRHSAQIRTHMNKLAAKTYWTQFKSAPDYVIMFIPGESFFASAVEGDTTLIEDALLKRVLIATPTTLIALLGAVAYGWRQEQIAKNAQSISDLGRTLYERSKILVDHITDIGAGLTSATAAYNKAAGSLEGRVLVSMRKFKELGAATGNELPSLEPVAIQPRSIEVQLDGEGK